MSLHHLLQVVKDYTWSYHFAHGIGDSNRAKMQASKIGIEIMEAKFGDLY